MSIQAARRYKTAQNSRKMTSGETTSGFRGWHLPCSYCQAKAIFRCKPLYSVLYYLSLTGTKTDRNFSLNFLVRYCGKLDFYLKISYFEWDCLNKWNIFLFKFASTISLHNMLYPWLPTVRWSSGPNFEINGVFWRKPAVQRTVNFWQRRRQPN